MIILGTYPNLYDRRGFEYRSAIDETHATLTYLAPPGSAFHLLPFYPSDGDGGFAPSDWFSVDPRLGTLDDIRALSRSGALFVDGIYSHVGVRHKWAREFFEGSGDASRIRTLVDVGAVSVQVSPRGWPVAREFTVRNVKRLAWQTFSPASIDIDLDNAEVNREILRHLDFLAGLGVRGVRLDAPAYYGKPIRGPLRHSEDSIRHFRRIVSACTRSGLTVIAQLNCNSVGHAYHEGAPVAFLQDYSLPALVAVAMLDGDTTELVTHLAQSWHTAKVIRPLRTHDGILLKTGAVDDHRLTSTAPRFERHGAFVRHINGVPYEVNNSFPWICAQGTRDAGNEGSGGSGGSGAGDDHDRTFRGIDLALSLVMMLPGIPYLYVPLLHGWTPEEATGTSPADVPDPRDVNRIPMSREHGGAVAHRGRLKRTKDLLARLQELRTRYHLESPAPDDRVIPLTAEVFALRRSHGLTAVFNFSRERTWCGWPGRPGDPGWSAGDRRGVRVGPRSCLVREPDGL
ncbi:alpha-amylase family glycosyl hydrolase [Streptomyces sp. SBT349]|uniref:alpha-amylase family glycosyl hydrolase n=1 Tax=Streptomyces sp. SBT349 TaxID=1580539 RepID=UPI00131A8E2B|nr:alpha-amylase family glycosyl hydrolase [Streptomyces sp. SBT349]